MAGFEDIPSGVVLEGNGRPEIDSWQAWYLRAIHWQVMILFFVVVGVVGHYIVTRYGVATKSFLVFVLASGLVFWAVILRLFFILRGFLEPRSRLVASILCTCLIVGIPYFYFANPFSGPSFQNFMSAWGTPSSKATMEPEHSVAYDPWDPTHGYITYKLNPYAEVTVRDEENRIISSFETHYRYNQKLPEGRYMVELAYLGRHADERITVQAGRRYIVNANMFRMDTVISSEGG